MVQILPHHELPHQAAPGLDVAQHGVQGSQLFVKLGEVEGLQQFRLSLVGDLAAGTDVLAALAAGDIDDVERETIITGRRGRRRSARSSRCCRARGS